MRDPKPSSTRRHTGALPAGVAAEVGQYTLVTLDRSNHQVLSTLATFVRFSDGTEVRFANVIFDRGEALRLAASVVSADPARFGRRS